MLAIVSGRVTVHKMHETFCHRSNSRGEIPRYLQTAYYTRKQSFRCKCRLIDY